MDLNMGIYILQIHILAPNNDFSFELDTSYRFKKEKKNKTKTEQIVEDVRR